MSDKTDNKPTLEVGDRVRTIYGVRSMNYTGVIIRIERGVVHMIPDGETECGCESGTSKGGHHYLRLVELDEDEFDKWVRQVRAESKRKEIDDYKS